MLELFNLGLSLPLHLAVPRTDRTGYGKALELEIAIVAEEVIAEHGLRPDRGWPVATPDARAAAFWTPLRNHSVLPGKQPDH